MSAAPALEVQGIAPAELAHRADWPGEEPQLVVYCPLCAERELGCSDELDE